MFIQKPSPMENTDWLDWTASILAFGLLLGGFLMMFTSIWTSQRKKGKL
jgi:hypothetical protein